MFMKRVVMLCNRKVNKYKSDRILKVFFPVMIIAFEVH
jgi:hypothetical protein